MFGLFDDEDEFDFNAPAKSAPTGGSPPHDSDPHDSDPHDFWKHEPTRSMPRISGRRKPSSRTNARAARPARPNRPNRSRSGGASRTRATREHGETKQIPVIDPDGVIILDDTACRPFDAATGLGGMNSRSHSRPQRTAATAEHNPLMRRIGAMALLLSLGIPVASAMGDNDDRAALVAAQVAALAAVQATAPTVAAAIETQTAPAVETPLATATAEQEVVLVVNSQATETAAAQTIPAAQPVAVVAAPVCVKTYTVALGDGWLLIAQKHNVAMDEVLAANAANISTFLMVGAEICVPGHATTPTAVPEVTTPPVTQPATKYVAPFSLACAKTYTVVLGDGWQRIANKHNVAMKDVLAANAANASTFLMVGKKICVPANAASPTATPTTTKATPTTKAPRPAPTPTIYPPTRSYTAAEVEAIIREIWPDELEEEALRIAKRESRLNPRAQNYCCYGLFQIYYNVHKKWLAEMGVTSGEQLLDPTIAAQAGLKLYQRNGWGPWKL